MCADLLELGKAIKELESIGTEYLHVDIMDGSFVPNFTLGTDLCRILKGATKIPLDIHLMVDKPEDKVSWFFAGEGDFVSFHIESTVCPEKVIEGIRSTGAKPMIAVSPSTGETEIKKYLPLVDGVLVMTVNPGFAGQKYIPETLEKVRRIKMLAPHLPIEVDGNVNPATAEVMSASGADIFVLGTSGIFRKDVTITEAAAQMRKLLGAIE